MSILTTNQALRSQITRGVSPHNGFAVFSERKPLSILFKEAAYGP